MIHCSMEAQLNINANLIIHTHLNEVEYVVTLEFGLYHHQPAYVSHFTYSLLGWTVTNSLTISTNCVWFDSFIF